VAEDLGSPGQAYQVIVFDNAAMAAKNISFFEGENEMFVTQANQLNEVACLGVSGVEFPGHEMYCILEMLA